MGNTMEQDIREGTDIDISFSDGNKLTTSKGRVEAVTSEGMVITLDISDKSMTPPPGTDIYVLKGGGLYNIVDSTHFPRLVIERVVKRNHARVDDVLKISYRKIPSEEYARNETQSRLILEDTFGESRDIPEIEEISTALLYKLIYQLSLKVDRLIDMMESKQQHPYKTIFDERINISASGMRFMTDEEVQEGDIMALRIALPLAMATRLHVLAEVVSIQPPTDDQKRMVSVKFIDLSQEVKETITRYVFKRQRELLRREGNE